VEIIAENIVKIRQRIQAACQKYHRNSEDIRLVAMGKGHSVESIRQAYKAGLRDFGENYVQEWLIKQKQLVDLKDIVWHFTGHLQTNKIKQLYAPKQTPVCLHSLDRLSLLEALAKRAQETKQIFSALIQLCVDPDDRGKVSGARLEVARQLCEAITRTPHIQLMGFMGMGPDTNNARRLQSLYGTFVKNAKDLWADFQQGLRADFQGETEPILSLGMSDDLELAIEAGSTLVRVGRGIFGDRSPPVH
jgi:pyridoxal phosphate enzyme (YggS family)